MRSFIILGFAVLYAAAAPTTFLVKEAVKEPKVKILKEINQLNEDGSYTFGFEAADGSFRKETRDVHGHVTGRYGYVDANGQLHELEYVSGQQLGKTIGFQIKSAAVPVSVAKVAPAPVSQKLHYQHSNVEVHANGQRHEAVKAVHTPTVVRYVQETPQYDVHQAKTTVVPIAPAPVNQKVLDFQYSSVDDNEDGQPDEAVQVAQTPTVVQYVQEAPVQKYVVQQVKSTVVPVASAPVDQKALDYGYSSVDDNQDGQPDDAVKIVQTPTVVQYVQEAPKYVVHQTKSTVVPVISASVDQKVLDYKYSSVDDNEDGQPDAAVQVAKAPSVVKYVQETPIQQYVVQQVKSSVVPVVQASVDQKTLDYQYSSVDDNQDGQPDDAVKVVQTPTVVQYVQEAPKYVVQQTKSTVVPVVSSSVNQKELDYRYSSVDDNEDGQPDDAVKVVQTPTAVQYVQGAPKYVVHQAKSTVVPVVSASVDQKTLDYQYSSVDDNEDGQPDDTVKVVQTPTVVQYVQEAPKYVVHHVKSSVVPVAQPSVDQKSLDYRYSSVDDNQDGQPDDTVQVVQTPTVVQYVQEAPAQQYVVHQLKSAVVPVASASVDQKALDYRYSSVDDNQDGIPDAAGVIVQQPTVVRYEHAPVFRVIQTVVPTQEVIAHPTVIRTVQTVSNGPVDHFIKDLRYHSVDVDEDGIPDEAIEVKSLPVVVGRIY